MIQVQLGDWAALRDDAMSIRTAVFICEQRVPVALEWDEADTTAVHAVAYDAIGVAVATGRMVQAAPAVAHIGRMAVLAGQRKQGIGRAVLDALVRVAVGRGDKKITLHAQVQASAFYRQAGFCAYGAVFEEAGIQHVRMSRRINLD